MQPDSRNDALVAVLMTENSERDRLRELVEETRKLADEARHLLKILTEATDDPVLRAVEKGGFECILNGVVIQLCRNQLALDAYLGEGEVRESRH